MRNMLIASPTVVERWLLTGHAIGSQSQSAAAIGVPYHPL